MRSHLSWLVAAWLLSQTAALGAPLLLARGASAAEPGQVVCACPGAKSGEACPMHRPDHAAPKQGGFLLQNPCAPLSAALLFLAGGIALPAARGALSGLMALPDQPLPPPTPIVDRDDTPDSPPPRA